MELSPLEIRRRFKESDDIRDAGLSTPPTISRIDDLSYGSAPENLLDIYFPKNTRGSLPTIVSIHGGGYVYGDKERYQYYCMSLAEQGFTVVNFTYRLAPEHKYPAPLEDTNAVMQFLCAHAEEYPIDLNNIFFVGDSAGAQLNSQYCTIVSNPEYAEVMGILPPHFRLGATALNCGMYRFDIPEMAGFADSYLGCEPAELGKQGKVLEYVTPDFPPAFVMSAAGDFLLPQAQPMYEWLISRGVEAELHIYGETGINDLGHVFHCNIRTEDAKQCNREECDFFKRHLEN